jgi:hypothetical protein
MLRATEVLSHACKPTHQSNMPDAFLVLHHCLSPFLKSSPLLAFGSLSASLHPASVQPGGASAGRSVLAVHALAELSHADEG